MTSNPLPPVPASPAAPPPDAQEPDANDLACLAAGTPDGPERAAVLRRLISEPGDLGVALALAEAADEGGAPLGSPARPETPGRRRRALAWGGVAALALVAVLAWVRAGSERAATQPPPPGASDPEDGFRREVERVVALRPSAAEGLRDEHAPADGPGPAPLERGGLVVCSPRGRLREERPAIAWVDRLTAGPWEVRLIDHEGRELWRATSASASLGWPGSVPGLAWGQAVVVSVAADVGGLVHRGAAAARRLTEDEERQRRLALEAVEDVGAARWLPLLRFRVARRFDLWSEAWAALEAPSDPSLAATVDGLRRDLRERLPCGPGS